MPVETRSASKRRRTLVASPPPPDTTELARFVDDHLARFAPSLPSPALVLTGPPPAPPPTDPTALARFVDTHLARFAPTLPLPAYVVEYAEYTTVRLLHRGAGPNTLFLFWNPSDQTYRIEWHRAIVARGQRLAFVEHHVSGCDGSAPPDKNGIGRQFLFGRLLAKCACPITITDRRTVWMVMPRACSVSYMYDAKGQKIDAVPVPIGHGQLVVPSDASVSPRPVAAI